MTQQYLVGELSLHLARLRDVAGQPGFEQALTRLRREAEKEPVATLPRRVRDALELGDQLCWDSLARGDTTAFRSQSEVCADLYDFAVSASLLAG